MLLSAVSVLVVAQPSSEFAVGSTNYPVFFSVSSRLPPSGETCRYATAPSTSPPQKKNWIASLPIDMLFSAVSVLVVAQPSSEVPDGRTNYPVFYSVS